MPYRILSTGGAPSVVFDDPTNPMTEGMLTATGALMQASAKADDIRMENAKLAQGISERDRAFGLEQSRFTEMQTQNTINNRQQDAVFAETKRHNTEVFKEAQLTGAATRGNLEKDNLRLEQEQKDRRIKDQQARDLALAKEGVVPSLSGGAVADAAEQSFGRSGALLSSRTLSAQNPLNVVAGRARRMQDLKEQEAQADIEGKKALAQKNAAAALGGGGPNRAALVAEANVLDKQLRNAGINPDAVNYGMLDEAQERLHGAAMRRLGQIRQALASVGGVPDEEDASEQETLSAQRKQPSVVGGNATRVGNPAADVLYGGIPQKPK